MKTPARIITAGIIGLVALFLVFSTYVQVQPNEEVVVTDFGKIAYTAGPGFHLLIPFVNSYRRFRTDIQELHPDKGVNTYTIDNQEVDVSFSVFYRIPDSKVAYIYTNVPDYSARLFTMAVDRLKAEVGKINVTQMAAKRGELRDAVKKVLAQGAQSLGLEVTDFQLTDLQYDAGFRKAVQNAAVQKANVEAQEYKKQQAEKDAETAVVQAEGAANAVRAKAKGDADAKVLQAQAEAKAIQVQGEAQADAIKAQAEALKSNPGLVDLRRAERWDGRLPANMYGSAPIPFLNVK